MRPRRCSPAFGGKRPVRVIAHRARLDGDARERLDMLGDERHIAKARIACDDALALSAAGGVLNPLPDHAKRHAQHGRQAQKHIAIVGDVRIGEHRQRRAVRHQREPVGVVDHAARRRGGDVGVHVVGRLAGIGSPGEHLHVPQARGKRDEDAGA